MTDVPEQSGVTPGGNPAAALLSDPAALAAYLTRLHDRPARVTAITRLDQPVDEHDAKAYGYGVPLRVDYVLDGPAASPVGTAAPDAVPDSAHPPPPRAPNEPEPRTAVLHTMAPAPFGHEHMADRAAVMLWSHDAFGRLPRHLRSLDVGGVTRAGRLVSLGDVDELFLLTDFAPGAVYAADLEQMRDRDAPAERDIRRADALCDYLVGIHATKRDAPSLYTRRIRELVGHGECIMGLIDSYPPDHPIATPLLLERIEAMALAWRWRIKARVHRLAQVHGDFHPWNILFDEADGLHVLDRSRGMWGDPADDVTSLSMNYVFESVQAHGVLTGAFGALHERLWRRYLDATGDDELLDVAPPFIAFRGLVMASPVWFPDIDEAVRGKMLSLVVAALESERYEPERVNDYLTSGRAG
ncbi:MAG: phosphotransferase [Phycisphaera sp.]|nr:phosphotransferase [Phycisphaera sp.]